ncbi:MAG TPA: co-chaperone YbbN [Caulobacteraceae bacterium]|nr:co-chaperone YbbN [Caulobacteraceae bacterium]
MSLLGETARPPADLIKEGSDASFVADVVEASKTQPVIVDFWATWCGPCKQLGPALEKAVKAANGAVKLVKIDIDRNPVFAGQLRVQSIPTVYAFVDGRPVDGFMGALPDSQIKTFIDKLIGPQVSEADELLAAGQEALGAGDVAGAAQLFGELLQLEPDNLAGVGGLARCYLAGGDLERAREVAAMAPDGAKNADLESVRAALQLAEAAPAETAEAERRLRADPNDHAARLELAKALAGRGKLEAAMEQLLDLLARDRDFEEGAARKELLTIFEAAGQMSELTRQGRRRMSSILFA